jgi:hypothetical protein
VSLVRLESIGGAQINGMIALEKVNTMVSNIPQGWKDDGKTLVAPNGAPVVRGFREWVLAHGWDANNTPLKAEQSITAGSIEPGNAAMGPGSRQDFRFKSLGWTTRTGVYEIAVGQDIVALEAQLAAALTHVSALEAQVQRLQNQPSPPPPNPKAVEALAAVLELAKALTLVAACCRECRGVAALAVLTPFHRCFYSMEHAFLRGK